MFSLIDQQIVPESHFDHLLVCEWLPATLDGLDEASRQAAISAANFDFKSCMIVSDEDATSAAEDFSTRVSELGLCTLKKEARECGGCWVSFEENTHPYVRGLLKAGRVVVK